MQRVFRFLARVIAAGFLGGLLPAVALTTPPNYQGIWWNSPPGSESGWGIHFAHQGDVIFATWLTYGTDGKGWWLVLVARRAADGTYGGTIFETRGPPFNAVPFDPARVTVSTVGSGTLAFRDLDNGTLRYTVKGSSQTKNLTRQVFGSLPTCAYAEQQDLASATNYQDLWWAGESESGWGVSIAHEGDTLFATWFTYDADGKPQWLVISAPMQGPRTYGGALLRTTGPPFNAAPFDPARVQGTVVGRATFAFADGNAGTFSYELDGKAGTKSITRQLVSPGAGTRCGAPYRTPAPAHVVAASDIADCNHIAAADSPAARTARLVQASDSLVLTLGDAAYESGTPEEYANCFAPTWGALKDRIRPVPGNHDYYTPRAAGYYGYFGSQAIPDSRGFYSFDHAGWHVIALNAEVDLAPGSEQYQWLLRDLETSRDSLCTIATLHRPAFNSGANHGSQLAMRPAFAALQAAGVEIILSGHEHVYERFAPQRADGTADPARGLRQFTVGTGGGILMAFGTPLPNSEFRYNANWGVLRLSLDAGTYGWQFVAVDGKVIDSGTGTCHP